jgi:hypothetical protein
MLHSSAVNTWFKILYSHLAGKPWKDHRKKVRQQVSRLRLQPGTLNLMYDCYPLDHSIRQTLYLSGSSYKVTIW